MAHFYIMQASLDYSFTYGLPIGQKKYTSRCPKCGRPIGEPLLPISIKFVNRPSRADFIWSPPELLVTDRVKESFDVNDVKGIHYSEVVVEAENFDAILQPLLWHVLIHQAAHAARQMHVVPRRRCPVCGIIDYSTWDGGVVIDETTWDGSDLFRLHEDVVGLVASDKVQRLVTANGFTGVMFVPAEEYHDPFPDS